MKDLLDLTTEEKIGQLFVIGLPGPALDDAALALLDEVRPGGVCLFSRNIRDAEQTRELNDAIRSRLSVEPILCLDQEGGLVDRLRRILTPMPSASQISTAEDAIQFGNFVAEAVRILGFNLNFAPVVDVAMQSDQVGANGLYSRIFGADAAETAGLAGAFLEAMQDSGCVGCVKHFPGLGKTVVDSHEELPFVEASEDLLEREDLLPFSRLIETGTAKTVMAAHAAYTASRLQHADQNGKLLPSSLNSRFISGLLRETLGFDGVVFTDDLEMGAILKNYGIGEACVMALSAGCDMLAICADRGRIREGYDAVRNAVADGRISEERIDVSLRRITALKASLSSPLEFDAARLSELSVAVADFKAHLNK